jgi:hypothetical protein
MKSLVFFALTLTLTATGSYARGPAVEDFVGIESETPDVTPEGTEALFNFEQDVAMYQNQPAKKSEAVIVHHPSSKMGQQTQSWPVSAWLGVFVILGLPVVTWLLTMRHLRVRKVANDSETLPQNVTALPARPKAVAETKDDIKKAS